MTKSPLRDVWRMALLEGGTAQATAGDRKEHDVLQGRAQAWVRVGKSLQGQAKEGRGGVSLQPVRGQHWNPGQREGGISYEF